jgi:hypothetical protein
MELTRGTSACTEKKCMHAVNCIKKSFGYQLMTLLLSEPTLSTCSQLFELHYCTVPVLKRQVYGVPHIEMRFNILLLSLTKKIY